MEERDLYQTLERVENDHVAALHKPILLENQFFAVWDYVPGVTLKEFLKEKGPLKEEQVLAFSLELCDGLQALHKLGVVHRDINPNNIIVTPEGHLVIIDFGISRLRKAGLSTDTEFLGTAGFAAPEQYGFSQTGPRADVYALGVVMNYMLTLQFPTEKQAKGSLKKIINKCIQMDENNRYTSVAKLKEALTQVSRRTRLANYIPGFRKGVWWHSVIAILYYLWVAFLFFCVAVSDYGLEENLHLLLSTILLFVFPVIILFDVGDWLEKLLNKDVMLPKEKRWAIGLALSLCILVFIITL